MSTELWLEKADRLRSQLARLDETLIDDAVFARTSSREELERTTIARWLREEFSDERPEDTATLSLFSSVTR